eukprot:gene4261-22160_t
MDVTDDVSAELQRRGGTLLAVVNNAGTALGTLADLTPVAAYDTNMQVNFLGLVRVTRAFLPLLKAAAASGEAPRL